MKTKNMNLWGLCLFAVLFSLCFGQPSAHGHMYGGPYNINRVENPNFEYREVGTSYGDVPQYWYIVYAGTEISFDLKNDKALYGEKALMIYDNSDSLSAGLLSNFIPVTPGSVYKASVWGRRDGAYPRSSAPPFPHPEITSR